MDVPVNRPPKDALSPALIRFLEIKNEHPECLILYRMGDFYETFFDDAVRANQLIGITLTTRGKDYDGNPVPMAGVPEKTLDTYLARLVRLGVSVAICEQSGDPAKGPLERSLARIVTPGTLTETDLLPQKSDAALVALARSPKGTKRYGLARLVLSSGAFIVTSTTESDLGDEIARLAPSELLISQSDTNLVSEGSSFSVTTLPSWHFAAEIGVARLKELFGVADLGVFGFDNTPEILSAIGALLGYVNTTQQHVTPHIRRPVFETSDKLLGIDEATRRNLEIIEPLTRVDGPTLFKTLDCCHCPMGSRALKAALMNPTREVKTLIARENAIESFMGNRALAEDIENFLARLPDLERLSSRIALGSVRPRELLALKDASPLLKDLADKVLLANDPYFETLAKDLVIDARLASSIEAAIVEDAPMSLREGDVIRSEFDSELAQLRQIRDDAGSLVLEIEEREKKRTQLSTLRLEFNRVHGYYIEVSKSQASSVPEDYIRKQTLKNTERFTTPELKTFEAKAISAQEKGKELQKELYERVVAEIAAFIPAIQAAANSAARIDALCALASLAFENNWVKPELTKTPGLEIRGARHPVIENTVTHYTPNDCVLVPGRRLLVITGPNMGGKSTFMRSIALIVLLAHIGSFVPATDAKIGPVDRILTRIGASDDLARNRSTFMVEMTEAASILHHATDKSLVLMDEIGRGTSTFDGLSLAYAIAVELSTARKAMTLFATHYFELTQLADTYPEIANVHVSAIEDNDKIVFLHEITDGPANQSYGIAVASLAGIPHSVIKRARGILMGLEEKAAKEAPWQLSLFDRQIEESSPEDPARQIVKEIEKLDIDNLTPREALDILYALAQKAKNL